MSTSIRHIALVLFALILASCASYSGINMDALNDADILNFRAPDGEVLISGQPSPEQLEIAARAGVKHIINLRTAGEMEYDEAMEVRSLGMEYHSIPVAGGAGVNLENAESLEQLLARIDGEPVLVHCASGNRAGGLFAVNAFRDGASLEAAIAEGTRYGLRSDGLKQAIRSNLSGN